MTDRISRGEIRKDAIQESLTATSQTVGQVAGIVTGAFNGVVSAVGGLATELFEIREAARRAALDSGLTGSEAEHDGAGGEPPVPPDDRP